MVESSDRLIHVAAKIIIRVFGKFRQLTRLIPNANGTTVNQRIEKVSGTQHSRILRVPFQHEGNILKNWISRFDVYPYLENYAQVRRDFGYDGQQSLETSC